jgi:hypothetical protein
MKQGDKLEVFVGGVVVGYAEVETIGEDTVTVLIPAQRFVGKKKVSVDLSPEPVEGASTVVLTDGVDQQTAPQSAPAEPVNAPVSPANNEGVSVPPETPAEPTAPAPEPVAVTSEEVSGEANSSND